MAGIRGTEHDFDFIADRTFGICVGQQHIEASGTNLDPFEFDYSKVPQTKD
jgi:hypothetical protein